MIPSSAIEAATQIIEAAEKRGVRLRLLGGLAFKMLCPSSRDSRYFRSNKDIDLMGKRDDSREIVKIMETLGYKPRELFNKLNLGQRLIYYDMENKRRVDLFLDEFVMCHKFNFKESILAGTYTLPMTQLLMTKLQVVEKTDKEYKDLVVAFRDCDAFLEENTQRISFRIVIDLQASNLQYLGILLVRQAVTISLGSGVL